MKFTRKKIRKLIKEKLNEGIPELIEKRKIENKIIKQIKNEQITSDFFMGLESTKEVVIKAVFYDKEDMHHEIKLSEKIGKIVAEYLNKKVRFQYKDGKIILTPPKEDNSNPKYNTYKY
tara:strand:- start:29 stop:385 length:357 start_codon:yes stop_codon:yes gene_type:complete